MKTPRTATVWIAAALAAAVTILWRVLTFTGFTNDHYVHLSRAQQMVLGDWPVRDFVDPGMPLMYLVSAIAELAAGRALWVEVGVVALAYACGSALTLLAATRLSGRLSVAAGVTAILIVLNPRSYSYPKITLYALAGWLFTWAAERPTRGRTVALALLTSVAFLFRHDHGLYIGVGALVLVLCRRDAGGVIGAIRQGAVFGGLVLVLLAPWALYVQHYGGLVDYFQSGIQFSRKEAAASTLEAWPWLDRAASSRANASVWLFYLFHLLPLVALVLAWRPSLRRSAEQQGAVAAVSGLAVMGMCANAGFLREELVPRIPDAAAIAALLGAYSLGRLFDAWPGHAGLRAACRLAGAGALAVTVTSSAIIADLAGQVDNARLQGGIGRVLARLDDLRVRLARPLPEAEQVPSRHAAALMPFFRYMERCTRPTDRMLVTGLMPETLVLAHRGFAGGHMAYFSGYYSSPTDQETAVDRLRHQSVPVVVLSQSLDEFRSMMPIVGGFVADNYSKGAEVPVEHNPPVELYFRRSMDAARDAQTGWPCWDAHQPARTGRAAADGDGVIPSPSGRG